MAMSVLPAKSGKCVSCGADVPANFCSECGEKKLNPDKDYSIKKFLEQTVDGFTHFDTKFLRSFNALLFKPGFLTSEFINGRRTRYMKPVQIFIISSVLFYFIFPTNGTFYSAVQDMEGGNVLEFNVRKAIDEKIAADNWSEANIIKETHLEAAHRSKAYLFVLIPLWGLIFYLLFFRSTGFLVPHLVFAIHNLSFFIIVFLANLAVFALSGMKITGDAFLIPVATIFFVYLFIAIRTFYHRNIFWSLIKSAFAIASFFLLVVVYRQVITAWVLSS